MKYIMLYGYLVPLNSEGIDFEEYYQEMLETIRDYR